MRIYVKCRLYWRKIIWVTDLSKCEDILIKKGSRIIRSTAKIPSLYSERRWWFEACHSFKSNISKHYNLVQKIGKADQYVWGKISRYTIPKVELSEEATTNRFPSLRTFVNKKSWNLKKKLSPPSVQLLKLIYYKSGLSFFDFQLTKILREGNLFVKKSTYYCKFGFKCK